MRAGPRGDGISIYAPGWPARYWVGLGKLRVQAGLVLVDLSSVIMNDVT